MATPERRQNTARGRARREEVLEAALRAFAAQGYRGASLASIADEVGISLPGLLHHFPSKQALLLGALERQEELTRVRMNHLRESAGGSLAASVVDLAQQHEADPAFIRLFTVLAAESVDPDHPAHDWFVARYRRVRARWVEELVEDQQLGRLGDTIDADELVRLIVALLDGLELQYLLDPGSVDIVTPLRAFLRMLGEPERRG